MCVLFFMQVKTGKGLQGKLSLRARYGLRAKSEDAFYIPRAKLFFLYSEGVIPVCCLKSLQK